MATLITEQTFQAEVINSNIPVLLDVFTPNCGPCRMLTPLINKLATEYAGKVKIVKIDGSTNPNVSATYRVSSVPSLLIFKGGVEVERKVGFLPEPKLRAWLDGI